MATRRHRIVIKPNIRPAGPKISGTAPPKPKILTANAVSEPPSPAIRQQQVPFSQEEKHQLLINEEDRNGEATSDTDIAQHCSKTAVDLLEKDATESSAAEVTDAEGRVSSVMNESKSGAHNQEESAHSRNEKTLPSIEQVSSDHVSDKFSSNLNITSITNAEPPSGHQRKSPKSSTPDVEIHAYKSKDITDSADVKSVIVESETTPSEVDGSCMSEAMSLDPDDERKEEVGDKAQKKRRWHKSKKLRTEPLPSREKSPDRQKMKMGDLLAWNPQQNFFPKKKKRSPLKNDNRPLSPALSLTVEDDKESTTESASLPAPQVMIGPDGSIILNTESLLIQTQKEDSKPRAIIEDDDDDRYLNTNTYRKYQKTKQWTERETEKFFMGLSMCGTDFSLLTNLLSNRSRRELKNKFHREERRNRDLIDKALANRQRYDLTPFERMAAEDDISKKKEIKKQLKKATANEKTKKATKAKGKKRKKKESEDEQEDWCPEYEEEDEENQNNEAGSTKTADVAVPKRKSKMSEVKKELDNQNRPKSGNLNDPDVILEDSNSTPFLPGYTAKNMPHVQESLVEEIPLHSEYKDLDNPKMRSIPAKTYSKATSENSTSQQQTPASSIVTNFNTSSSVIQAIPGSTQVQIEMEGVQNLVQGVLIPSHMVPQIAPQLGIHGNAVGIQVLLVQEEAESGSLVHVYVIPEGETARSSGDNLGGGTCVPGNHPAFSSPIPSPHPNAAIQSPHSVPPFSPHPLAPVCNPHSNSTHHNPPLHNPMAADPLKRPFPQAYISPKQQNLHPQPVSAKPYSDTSFTQQVQHHNGLDMSLQPPPAGKFSSSVSHNAPTIHNSTQDRLANSNNHHTHFSSGTDNTSSHSVNIELLPHTTDVAIPFQHASSSEILVTTRTQSYNSDVVVAVVDDTTVKLANSEVNSIPYNYSSTSETANSELDDDCVIIDSDKPHSQLDKCALVGN